MGLQDPDDRLHPSSRVDTDLRGVKVSRRSLSESTRPGPATPTEVFKEVLVVTYLLVKRFPGVSVKTKKKVSKGINLVAQKQSLRLLCYRGREYTKPEVTPTTTRIRGRVLVLPTTGCKVRGSFSAVGGCGDVEER